MATFPGLNSRPRAAAWNLEPSASDRPSRAPIPAEDGSGGDEESVMGEDYRSRVSPNDILDGGKFRSIVKILSRFPDKTGYDDVLMMGTGWLIAPDLVVTAGHIVYDWNRRLGAASQTTCYIGYSGRDSVNTSGVQRRLGRSIVTTAEWISDRENRSRDVAFIQLDRPFTGNLRLFSYIDTPLTYRSELGVVGYPGDKMSRGEKGAEMYQMFDIISFNLETHDMHMIKHQMSTFNGQAGAPVLKADRDRLVSIGCHTYRDLGTPINGKYGINYDSYISLLTGNKSGFGTPSSIKILETSAAGKSNPTSGLAQATNTNRTYRSVARQPQHVSMPPFPETESFFDVLKSVSKVGNRSLSSPSPLTGPVGSSVSVTAGTIIQSAIQTEGAPDEVNPARAILAEASLQAVLSLVESEELQEVLHSMQKTWISDLATDIAPIAKVAAPLLTESALEISVERMTIAENLSHQQNKGTFQPLQPLKHRDPYALPNNAFVEGLLEPTRPLANDQGFFDSLGLLFEKAVFVAKPIVSQVASSAVKGLAQAIDSKSNTARSGFVRQDSGDSSEAAAEILFHRAAMADVALQALMELSRDKLERLEVTHPENGETDGIFDWIKTTVQQIGPVTISSAQKAGQRFAAINQIPRHAASESSFSSRRGKSSVMDMLNNDNNWSR